MSYTRILFILITISPLFLSGFMVYKYSINVFLADEWDTPGHLLLMDCEGQLNYLEFLSQHNESRKLFPKLIYYSFAKIKGLDVKDVIFLRFFLLTLAVFYLCLRIKNAKLLFGKKIIIVFIIFALAFIPTQAISFLTSIQIITIIPPFLIILFFYYENKIKDLYTCFLYFSVCLISMFSFANGMLLWLICATPIVFGRPKTFQYFKVFIIGSLLFLPLCLFVYFFGYERPSIHPSFILGFEYPLKSFLYFLLWIGSPFASAMSNYEILGLTLFDPKILGIIVGGIVFVLIVYNSYKIIFRIGVKCFVNRFSLSPWFALLIYALISGIIASLGRSGLGIAQALSPQYPSISIWLYIGLFGLFVEAENKKRDGINLFFAICLVILVILSYPSGLHDMKMLGERCKEGELTVKLNSLIPDNPLFQWTSQYGLYPARNHVVKDQFNDLCKKGLIDFKMYDKEILEKNLSKKKPPTGGCFSYKIEKNKINIFGWAMLPHKLIPADFVLICHEENLDIKATTGLLLNTKRPDVSEHLNIRNQDDSWGFEKTILTSDFVWKNLSAYAVDKNSLELYPLLVLDRK